MTESSGEKLHVKAESEHPPWNGAHGVMQTGEKGQRLNPKEQKSQHVTTRAAAVSS